jgi:DNA primase
MDVVALAQHGVECAVATLGTATTPVHLQKLFRFSDEVVFCFDGDAAGRRAAWHALEVALPALSDTKAVRFMFLPPEHDPDTFVRERGREAFEAEMAGAKPLSEFLLSEMKGRCDLATAEGRARFLAEAEPLFKRINAPVLRLQLQKQLLSAADVSPEDIEHLTGRRSAPSTKPASPPREQRRTVNVETKILAYLILYPRLADGLPREIFDPNNPQDSTILAVVDFIAQRLPEAQRERDCGALLLDSFAQAPDHLRAIRDAQIWGHSLGFGVEEAEAEFGPALEKRRDRLRSERHTYLGALIKRGQASQAEVREFTELSMPAVRPQDPRASETGGDSVTPS